MLYPWPARSSSSPFVDTDIPQYGERRIHPIFLKRAGPRRTQAGEKDQSSLSRQGEGSL